MLWVDAAAMIDIHPGVSNPISPSRENIKPTSLNI
jgi:hypothetical protein